MYENSLAKYAARSASSRGRRYPEPDAPGRTLYQRDRDRIIHSAAFRRLEYKTQVFVNTESDLYRTRLTHTLEVAQIARSIARQLGLNEDLTEAIALAHDLGHTPFGHAGQDALHECMAPYGGFEHNLHSLRVVDELEERYPAFYGLNLSFETREGILKHCSLKHAKELGDVAERFILKQQPLLEAQVANLADEIAYNNHDMDDGLRSRLITLEQARSVPLFEQYHDEVSSDYPQLSERRKIHETVRRLINALIYDLLQETRQRISHFDISDSASVRTAPPLVGFSQAMHHKNQALKKFLMKHLYRHNEVLRTTVKAKRIVKDLFQAFFENPALLPAQCSERPSDHLPQVVADYIAGMTDRYAVREHNKLFDLRVL